MKGIGASVEEPHALQLGDMQPALMQSTWTAVSRTCNAEEMAKLTWCLDEQAGTYTSLQVASSTLGRKAAACPVEAGWNSWCFLAGRAAVRAAKERWRIALLMDLARPAKCCSSSARLKPSRSC